MCSILFCRPLRKSWLTIAPHSPVDLNDVRLRPDTATKQCNAATGTRACRTGDLAMTENSLLWPQTNRDQLRRFVFWLLLLDRVCLLIHSFPPPCLYGQCPQLPQPDSRIELLSIGKICCGPAQLS